LGEVTLDCKQSFLNVTEESCNQGLLHFYRLFPPVGRFFYFIKGYAVPAGAQPEQGMGGTAFFAIKYCTQGSFLL
jgi:hypothetical protein